MGYKFNTDFDGLVINRFLKPSLEILAGSYNKSLCDRVFLVLWVTRASE